MIRYSLVCLALLGAAAPGQASSWADGLFDTLSRDFGSVPHGHVATHPFRLVNRTGSVVHITNVRVSCGCTSAHALQHTLAPGQDTAIFVQMDTRRFYGFRAVTVYVQFDQPEFDEVRLVVQSDSRDDVAVMPESLSFGRIKRGAAPSADVTVSFLGDSNCRITGAHCDSNYIDVTYDEVRRGDGEVDYKISAKVHPDVPAGKWYTDVWLTTNNSTISRLRVPLSVEVGTITGINVQKVALGTIKAGAASDRQVILRGIKPFRVTDIGGTDAQVKVQDTERDARSVHILRVTLRPDAPGTFTRIIRVRTDMPNAREIELNTSAQVVP